VNLKTTVRSQYFIYQNNKPRNNIISMRARYPARRNYYYNISRRTVISYYYERDKIIYRIACVPNASRSSQYYSKSKLFVRPQTCWNLRNYDVRIHNIISAHITLIIRGPSRRVNVLYIIR